MRLSRVREVWIWESIWFHPLVCLGSFTRSVAFSGARCRLYRLWCGVILLPSDRVKQNSCIAMVVSRSFSVLLTSFCWFGCSRSRLVVSCVCLNLALGLKPFDISSALHEGRRLRAFLWESLMKFLRGGNLRECSGFRVRGSAFRFLGRRFSCWWTCGVCLV